MKSSGWVLLIVGILVLSYFANLGGLQDTVNSWSAKSADPTQIAPTGYISTGATAFSFVGADAFESGTTVKLTSYVSVNGGLYDSSVTSGSPGDKISLLFDNTSYHAVYLPDVTVDTAPTQTFNVKLNKNASITVTGFNNNNDKLVSNGALAVNQTVTSGGSYNLKVRMDGEDKKSTNPMRCIIEASNGTAMKSMSLSGLGAKFVDKSRPASYTLAGSDSELWVYDIDAITGAMSSEGTIGVVSESGKDLAGSHFIFHCYTKEDFVDTTTGVVMNGIEDSTGTLKSIAHYSFTGNFNTV